MVFDPLVTDAKTRAQPVSSRYQWLTPERQTQVRGVLLGITLFFGLVVWVWHSLATASPQPSEFHGKLRVVGIMTWLYALIQLIDIRFWRSAIALKRRASMGIPESLIAWLFGQMLAWFGIIYYAFTDNPRWAVAGLAGLLLTFVIFPVRGDD